MADCFKSFLREYYDKAEIESTARSPKRQPYLPTNYLRLTKFFSDIKQFKINKILDIGCQHGFVLARIAAKEKYGVDVAKSVLKEAKKEGIHARYFDLNDKKPLPHKKSTFDFVISLATIEHILYPGFLVEEVYRVLKPGGFFYLMTDSAEAYTDKLHLSRIKQKEGFNEHLHLFTKKELLNLLSKFEIKKLFSYGFLIHMPLLDKICVRSRFVRTLFYYFNEILSKLPATKNLGGLYFCLAQKPKD